MSGLYSRFLTYLVGGYIRAKYPLAMMSKILSIFCERVGLGYDIGGSFAAIVLKSSLSNEVRRKALRLVVNAFPFTVMHTIGLVSYASTLFFTLQALVSRTSRLVSVSSLHSMGLLLPPVMRLFHRHQAIGGFARRWDEQKYQELGQLIYLLF